MADRWVVSRFNRTVADCNDALKGYRFDQYAKACYDFFWRDFCDWYVEASKPALRDPKRAGQVAGILATTLDGALRLMHPMIPYITEVLWWRLNEVRPERGLPGRIEAATSKRLIRAPWPTVGDFSQAAEHIWPKIQEIVTVIRNLRNEHKVDPRKPVSVSIRSQSPDSAMQVRNHKVEIELLATCRLKDIGPEVAAPQNSAKMQAAGCEVYIEDLVDTAAEQQRVTKRRDELNKQIAQLKARMSSEGYRTKAPPSLVQQTKDQLAAAEAELAKLS
jgi:valyl-tRNA synthetase